MNTPLAACLPDFGPDDTPRTIEDHTPPARSAVPSVAGPAKPRTTPAKGRDSKQRPVGDVLQSVSRHIRLVDEPAVMAPLVEPTPPVDVDALLKEHGDRIRMEEAGKAKVALATAIAEERRVHEEARRKERSAWVTAESSRLAEQLATSLSDLEESLSQSVVRIFAPFLRSAVRDKAISDLRDTVLALLSEDNSARIEVSGPRDLIDGIRDALANGAPDRSGQIVFLDAEGPDARVVAGDMVCATQLAVWNERIADALGLQ